VIAKKLAGLLEQLAVPNQSGETIEHRDAEVLLSLPGVGRQVAATMLSEASQAIAERDYHGLRCYTGVAPVTRQSGKKRVVLMRQACNERLRKALYHWSRVSVICHPKSKARYAALDPEGILTGERCVVLPTVGSRSCCPCSDVALSMPDISSRLTQRSTGPLAGARVSTGEKTMDKRWGVLSRFPPPGESRDGDYRSLLSLAQTQVTHRYRMTPYNHLPLRFDRGICYALL
ncbi:MAG: IS110 family transposase, partial [Acidobacteriia bacterium]|nr:IS110 family transposase [Terriglobia bacterium]